LSITGIERMVAGHREARLEAGRDTARFAGDAEAEHRARAGKRIGKQLVVVPEPGERGRTAAKHCLEVALGGEPRRRHAVGLGKGHIEHDGRRAKRIEPVGQVRQPVARPRPLAIGGKRLLVDVDHAHRFAPGLARLEALKLVEAELAHSMNREGVGGAQLAQRKHDDDAEQESCESRCLHGICPGPSRRGASAIDPLPASSSCCRGRSCRSCRTLVR
jgi:hypothetical protein